MDIILITNMELFFTMVNTSLGKASKTIQSTMSNGREPMNTVAGKENTFLQRPSGKKLHGGKMEEYTHGAINHQLTISPVIVKYGRKKLNTM